MSFVLSATAAGENKKAVKPGYKEWRGVVYTKITGSYIPQRVVVKGQNVNSAEPIYMVQNGELNRTGGTSLYGVLRLDPSITNGIPHH